MSRLSSQTLRQLVSNSMKRFRLEASLRCSLNLSQPHFINTFSVKNHTSLIFALAAFHQCLDELSKTLPIIFLAQFVSIFWSRIVLGQFQEIQWQQLIIFFSKPVNEKFRNCSSSSTFLI